MRIAIDARFYGTENTGLGRYTGSVLSHFFSESDTNEYIVFVRHNYKGLTFPGNVRVVPVEVGHYTLAEQFVIPYLLLKYRAQLLYTFHFNAPLLSPVPMVVTIHDLIKSHFQDISTSTHGAFIFALKRLGYRMVMGGVIARAKKIIVPSRAVKADILTAYPEADAGKIFPIHEAADDFSAKASSRATKSKGSSYNLLYVGNAYPHKNLRGLLSAFTILSRGKQDYHLTLLSKKTPFLQRELKELHPDLLKKVTVKELIDDRELLTSYLDAAALVTPSFMEGFGLPALEALSVGTPVVASDIPVYREIYGDHVTYCNPFDAVTIAAAIEAAVTLPRRVYHYSRTWAQVAADIRKVLL